MASASQKRHGQSMLIAVIAAAYIATAVARTGMNLPIEHEHRLSGSPEQASESDASARHLLAPLDQPIVAAYWGQGDAGKSLADACKGRNFIFLSFLSKFGGGEPLSLDIAGHDLTQTIADIKTCQSQNVQVILSMGGDPTSPNTKYTLANTHDATSVAEGIWAQFLGGQPPEGITRPLGDAVLNGVDLDIEKTDGNQYYDSFVKRMKRLYNNGPFFITAVPQCVFPDANLGPSDGLVLQQRAGSFDYVSIQFYNNEGVCSGSPDAVRQSYKQWSDWAASVPNGGPKLLPTFPATEKDASNGFLDAATVKGLLADFSSMPSYGGFNVFTAESDDGFTAAVTN